MHIKVAYLWKNTLKSRTEVECTGLNHWRLKKRKYLCKFIKYSWKVALKSRNEIACTELNHWCHKNAHIFKTGILHYKMDIFTRQVLQEIIVHSIQRHHPLMAMCVPVYTESVCIWMVKGGIFFFCANYHELYCKFMYLNDQRGDTSGYFLLVLAGFVVGH